MPSPITDVIIQTQHLNKNYETKAGTVVGVADINLTVHRGEFVGIIGKSGSGKSTLVNMLTGIDRPTSGDIHVGDVPVHQLGEGALAQWRGVNVGVIFQFFQLVPTLSVLSNIILPMDLCGLYTGRNERVDRAMWLLEQMEVDQHAHKRPAMLSGGQQQRVAIARALVNDPPIVIADEPTGSLDTKTANHVFKLFEEMVNQGKTFLMVTHDSDLTSRMSRVLTLSDGVITAESTNSQGARTPTQLDEVVA
ncbi:MAG: ABC transporter ATP-binding protein [Chloroflexota bacterium]